MKRQQYRCLTPAYGHAAQHTWAGLISEGKAELGKLCIICGWEIAWAYQGPNSSLSLLQQGPREDGARQREQLETTEI